MADARVSLPASVARGDAVEVRIVIRHPMETGYRLDERGKAIARNVIGTFSCRYGDELVLVAKLGPGIAANPYLRFFVTARASGELVFEWSDDAGARFVERARLTVA